MDFWKYHGLGNDFVIVNAKKSKTLMDADQARRVCHRYKGIGADGVLTVLPSEQAEARMHIYNADGSEAEMCGNGIRCFVKYLVEKEEIQQEQIEIETGAGIVACYPRVESDGKVSWVAVQMGRVVFDRDSIPMHGTGACIDEVIEVGDREFSITALSMGNPHAVLFEGADMQLALKYGPLIEKHILFPQRVNVGFAKVTDPQNIELIVYERGCGITQACGTGACAAVAAAARLGKVSPGREINVHLPGGDLKIRVSKDFSSVLLNGPAVEVFYGRMSDENWSV